MVSSEQESLQVDRSGDTITIWLNRPERRNVLTRGLIKELTRAFADAGDSEATGVILAARESKEIVGMVSLLFTISTVEGGPVCWLEDMVVRPDRRGDGLGSRLLQHAIDYAGIHGFRRITLLTDKVNVGPIRFYERHGFVESAMTVLRLDLKSP